MVLVEKFKSWRKKVDDKSLRKKSSKIFWMWIAYQTVKGFLTTTLIWIPLLLAWLHLD